MECSDLRKDAVGKKCQDLWTLNYFFLVPHIFRVILLQIDRLLDVK